MLEGKGLRVPLLIGTTLLVVGAIGYARGPEVVVLEEHLVVVDRAALTVESALLGKRYYAVLEVTPSGVTPNTDYRLVTSFESLDVTFEVVWNEVEIAIEKPKELRTRLSEDEHAYIGSAPSYSLEIAEVRSHPWPILLALGTVLMIAPWLVPKHAVVRVCRYCRQHAEQRRRRAEPKNTQGRSHVCGPSPSKEDPSSQSGYAVPPEQTPRPPASKRVNRYEDLFPPDAASPGCYAVGPDDTALRTYSGTLVSVHLASSTMTVEIDKKNEESKGMFSELMSICGSSPWLAFQLSDAVTLTRTQWMALLGRRVQIWTEGRKAIDVKAQ